MLSSSLLQSSMARPYTKPASLENQFDAILGVQLLYAQTKNDWKGQYWYEWVPVESVFFKFILVLG